MDRTLLRWINGWPDALAPLMRFLSEATNYLWFKIFLAVMLVAMVWRGEKSRRAAIQALVAFLLANEVTDLFKNGIPEPRPCTVLTDLVYHGVGCSDSAGTASAHSANMAAVAAIFTFHLGWKWGVPWIVVAFLTGLSRIYHGVHYPHQVLLGWTVGATVALAIAYGWRLIQRQRATVDKEEPASDDV